MNVLIETRFVRALLQFNKKPKVEAPVTTTGKQAIKALYIEQAGDKIRAYATNSVIAAMYTQDGFDMQAERQRMVIDRESLKNALSMLDGVDVIRLQNFTASDLIKISSDDEIFNCSALGHSEYKEIPIDNVFDQAKGLVDMDALNHINPDYLISLSQVGKILVGRGYGHFTPYIESQGSQIALLITYQNCPDFKAVIAPMRLGVEFFSVRERKTDALALLKKLIADGVDYADAQCRASMFHDVDPEWLQKAYDAESACAV